MRRLEARKVGNLPKASIPSFNKRGAYRWLIQFYQYFEDNKIHDVKVIRVTMFALTREAFELWSSWRQSNQKATWKVFAKAMKKFESDLWACKLDSENEGHKQSHI